MSKHTLGPWFSQYDDNGFYEIGSEAVAFRMAFTYGEGDTDEANARLIAAAPELLEALERMLHSFSPHPCENTEKWREEYDACELARAAIAKAKGEV